VLSEYAARYGAEAGRWYFVTGDKGAIRELLLTGFRLGVADASPEDLEAGAELVMHSSRFVLVDAEGTIRGYYDSSESERLTDLVRDALHLSRAETN